MNRLGLCCALSAAGLLLLVGCGSDEDLTCVCQPVPPPIITTYVDEPAFRSEVSPIEPVDAPFSGVTDSIVVGANLLVARPRGGADRIGVGDVTGDSLPSNLMVVCECYSNLAFAFDRPISGFGFGVESWTRPGDAGTSEFDVVLYEGANPIGGTHFSTPAMGYSFFALLSSVQFDALSLLETSGGPQEGPDGKGGIDRESFGRFYVVH
jgi:hypothetical protein